MTSLYRDETIQDLSASLVGRNDVVSRWGNAISSILMLPGLRGCWPMSAFDDTGQAFDQSGNGRTLTYNGNPTYNVDNNFVPYIDLDGTGDYLSRTDEAGLDILGTEAYVGIPGVTFGGWFFFDTIPPANGFLIIGKGNAVGNDSFYLWQPAAGGAPLQFFITSTGANYQQTPDITLTASSWVFLAARFTPSTEIKAWANTTTTTFTTAVHASLYNSTAPFQIGRWNGVGFLDGRASLCWLSTAALPDSTIIGLFEQQRVLFGV